MIFFFHFWFEIKENIFFNNIFTIKVGVDFDKTALESAKMVYNEKINYKNKRF